MIQRIDIAKQNNMSVMNFNEINVNDLTFSEPKVNSMGGLSVYVSYGGDKVTVQVPKHKCPFGLSSQAYDGAPEKYEVSISLNGGSEKAEQWKQWVSDLDKKVMSEAAKNSKAWFKSTKEKSASVIEELYRPIVIESKSTKQEYPPTQKFKIPFKDGKCYASFFNDKRETVEMDLMEKGCSVALIAEMQGLWFVGKQFGVTWRVVQAKIYPVVSLQAYAFKDEDDEVEEVDEEVEEEVEEVEVE